MIWSAITPGTPEPRDPRRIVPGWLMGLMAVVVVALIIVAAVAISGAVQKAKQVDQNQEVIQRLVVNERRTARALRIAERERVIRTDQACALFERDHLRDVTRLRETYEYLRGPEAALNPGLTRLVIQGEPELREEALTDRAPEYCDEAGIGLPEPDPIVPARPRGL